MLKAKIMVIIAPLKLFGPSPKNFLHSILAALPGTLTSQPIAM